MSSLNRRLNSTRAGGAIVTGGAVRLGRGICKKLANIGFGIVVHYRSSDVEAKSLVHEINSYGGNAVSVHCNLCDEESARSLVKRSSEAIRLNIQPLVNSASIFEHDTLQTMTVASFDNHMKANILAPTLLCSSFESHVRENNVLGASIVNILDQKLANTNGDHLAYTLSKYALAGLTDTLAR